MSGVATGHWPIEARILSLAVQGDTRSARELAAAALERGSSRHSGRARVMAYDSLASFVAADYETAAVTAEIALISFDRGGNGETEDGGEDRRASAVTAAARLVAAAGVTWAGDGEAIEDTGAAEDALLEGHDWAAEPLPRSLDGLPLPSMPLLPVRVLVFLGRVAEADRLAALVGEQAAADGDELWQALCDSVRAFCAGGMGDVAEVRRLAAAVRLAVPRPYDYLGASAKAFIGFGFAAAGRLEEAAIAAALGISGKTVERHLSAVFASWGVASRAAVAGIALAAGESFRQPPSARPSAAKTGESARVDAVAPPSPTQ